ncbi:MAG: hypothetical protein OXN27_13180 [Candidatus Poribacteria bacterium]|nr:hypothetical protein [Candidatus Poribacteria bacterium]
MMIHCFVKLIVWKSTPNAGKHALLGEEKQMYKLFLGIILIVAVVFFGGLLQRAALAETDQPTPTSDKQAETAASDKQAETEGSRLSGIDVTTGGFLSYLRDDVYVKDSEGNIKKDVQGHFAKSLGTLAHVPLFTLPEFKNQYFGHGGRLGIGLSGGFGLNGSDIVKNLQIVGGGSIFYKTKNAFIAFTYGRMVGPVQRLTGNYAVGNKFPDGNVGLTKPVYEVDEFFALTVSADVEKLARYFNVDKLFSGNTTDSEKEKVQSGNIKPPEKNDDKENN